MSSETGQGDAVAPRRSAYLSLLENLQHAKSRVEWIQKVDDLSEEERRQLHEIEFRRQLSRVSGASQSTLSPQGPQLPGHLDHYREVTFHIPDDDEYFVEPVAVKVDDDNNGEALQSPPPGCGTPPSSPLNSPPPVLTLQEPTYVFCERRKSEFDLDGDGDDHFLQSIPPTSAAALCFTHNTQSLSSNNLEAEMPPPAGHTTRRSTFNGSTFTLATFDMNNSATQMQWNLPSANEQSTQLSATRLSQPILKKGGIAQTSNSGTAHLETSSRSLNNSTTTMKSVRFAATLITNE